MYLVNPDGVNTRFHLWFQVETNRAKLVNDRALAQSQLHKKLGQLLYLNNLEKVGSVPQ